MEQQKPKRKYNKSSEPKLPPVYDELGNKLCPIHKKMYLLRQPHQKGYTGMCAHPDCIGKVITRLINGSQSFKRQIAMFKHLDCYEDFISYIYEKLLIEAEQGKPTIINGFWFKYKISTFTHINLMKGEAVLSRVPQYLRGKYSFGSPDDWSRDVIDREYEKFTERRLFTNPEEKAVWNELYRYVEDTFGKQWCLYLAGELSQLDMSKLEKTPLHIIRRKEKLLFRTIRDSFLNEENKEALMSITGIDGETPLKNIVVPARYEGRVKGGNQKMYRQYWETLADKVNMENGYTYRHERYERAIRYKLQQLRNIESQFPHTIQTIKEIEDEHS